MEPAIHALADVRATIAKHMQCATPEELQRWSVPAWVARPQTELEVLRLFCRDCSIRYEYQQRELGTCNRPPAGWDGAI